MFLLKIIIQLFINKEICYQKQIGQKLNFLMEMNTNFSHFECPIHELKEIIKYKFI